MPPIAKCESCKQFAEVRPVTPLSGHTFIVCESCEARIRVAAHKYPSHFLHALQGDQNCYFIFAAITRQEHEYMLALVRQARSYNRAGAFHRTTEEDRKQIQSGMKNFGDTNSIHPLPKLGEPFEPDRWPVMADKSDCKLSSQDRLSLHGLGVCWNSGDEALLPKPKDPDQMTPYEKLLERL